MKKIVTNNGKRGGWLKGKPHYDKNGKSLGGIKAIVTDAGNKPVELEGGEVIINKEASAKHWKELSRINQSAGNGVAIGPPSGYDEDPEEYKEGGKVIEFNPNHVPNKWILQYAKDIKEKHPEIWKLGGNIFGNQAFINLKRVSERGYWLDSEKWMYIKWRSYVARHKKDFRIEGVVAMLKWVDKVDKGWPYMKNLIEEKIEKIQGKKEKKGWKHKMKTGGRTIAQTPAPKKERIFGSKVNKPGSASSESKAKSIKLDESVIQSIKNKIEGTGVSLETAKAVVRRGMGAYSSSHRPTIKGGKPNSRTAWGLARLNAFLYKAEHGKSKSGKYTQDDDLLKELGFKVSKMKDGGNLEVNNACIQELINLIKTHAEVEYFIVDKTTNNLVIIFNEEIGVYDLDIYNHFLKQLTECNHIFEDEATFQNDTKTYRTIFIKLKNTNVDGLEMKDGGELRKGIKTEQEHRKTLEGIASGKYSVDEAIKKTAKDHLKEDPKYYTKLLKMEEKMNKGGTVTLGSGHIVRVGDKGTYTGRLNVKITVTGISATRVSFLEEGGEKNSKNIDNFKKQFVPDSAAEKPTTTQQATYKVGDYFTSKNWRDGNWVKILKIDNEYIKGIDESGDEYAYGVDDFPGQLKSGYFKIIPDPTLTQKKEWLDLFDYVKVKGASWNWAQVIEVNSRTDKYVLKTEGGNKIEFSQKAVENGLNTGDIEIIPDPNEPQESITIEPSETVVVETPKREPAKAKPEPVENTMKRLDEWVNVNMKDVIPMDEDTRIKKALADLALSLSIPTKSVERNNSQTIFNVLNTYQSKAIVPKKVTPTQKESNEDETVESIIETIKGAKSIAEIENRLAKQKGVNKFNRI